MLVVGTSPGSAVASDCTIIRDAVGNFMQFYDKPTLTIRFPEILRQLQGTDTNIEIITSSMLQPLQMSIKGNLISDISAYIFVQTSLQRDNLPAIEYNNADKRAEEARKFFVEEFKLDPKKVMVYEDLDKAFILSIFKSIKAEAQKFKEKNEQNANAAKAVFVNWIGFCLNLDYHPYLENFDIDDDLWPNFFPLT